MLFVTLFLHGSGTVRNRLCAFKIPDKLLCLLRDKKCVPETIERLSTARIGDVEFRPVKRSFEHIRTFSERQRSVSPLSPLRNGSAPVEGGPAVGFRPIE